MSESHPFTKYPGMSTYEELVERAAKAWDVWPTVAEQRLTAIGVPALLAVYEAAKTALDLLRWGDDPDNRSFHIDQHYVDYDEFEAAINAFDLAALELVERP